MSAASIRDLATVIRSKQAGPYRLTLDIIFRTEDVYREVKASGTLTPERIARLYAMPLDRITDFVFYDPGWALKITMVRPKVAGDPGDGDVYGCQQHAPLLGLTLELPGRGRAPAAREGARAR
jgi:hypothetical protein